MSTLSHSPNRTFLSEKAAIDITTGYGADSFLSGTQAQDPWGKDCLMSIIDAAINHREFYYPLPTVASADSALVAALPLSMASLHQVGILTPVRQTTAEQLVVSDKALESEYANFCKWVEAHPVTLKGWIALHSTRNIRKQAKARLGQDVQPFIADFWKSQQPGKLARRIGVKSQELRYTFDTMFRSLQYYSILSSSEVFYFPHPIRRPLLGGQEATRFEEYTNRWSWGRLIANLVETDRIRREPKEIADIVAGLQHRVLGNNATWYDLALTDKQWKDTITTIAGESALPAKVKDKVRLGVEVGLGVASLAAGLAMSTPLVSIMLGVLVLPAEFWEGQVPRAMGRLGFCRGLLEWPGLIDN
jgi:hypothetical protein